MNTEANLTKVKKAIEAGEKDLTQAQSKRAEIDEEINLRIAQDAEGEKAYSDGEHKKAVARGVDLAALEDKAARMLKALRGKLANLEQQRQEERQVETRKQLAVTASEARKVAARIDKESEALAASIEELRGLGHEHGRTVDQLQAAGGDRGTFSDAQRWPLRMSQFSRWYFGARGGLMGSRGESTPRPLFSVRNTMGAL